MVDNIENQERKVGKSASHRSAKDLHELVGSLAKTMEERSILNLLLKKVGLIFLKHLLIRVH